MTITILGIETSCDETAAAVVADGRVVHSNVIASQIELHRAHGGVVPELAARGQVTAIIPVVNAALARAGVCREDLDAIAVTQGPGLAGSLLVGVNAAKALAFGLRKPLVTVNHLAAHVYANWLSIPGVAEVEPPALPAVCLLVSGGHTELLVLEEDGIQRVLGRTLDDAAGEAFDKGARLLGLGYPGGPAIQKAAAGGNPAAVALPRAWLGESDDFSFSGVKTALLRTVEPYRVPETAPPGPSASPFPEHRPPRFHDDMPTGDLAASFEMAVVEVLAVKTARAACRCGARSVLIAGGVAANLILRRRLVEEVAVVFGGDSPPVRWPHLSLCTDNAAMVAGLGAVLYNHGEVAAWDADAFPRFPLGSAQLGSRRSMP